MNLFEIKNVTKTYSKRVDLFYKETFSALKEVSLMVRKGECIGIVGESGSGKSTLLKAILRLIDIDQGKVLYEGSNLHELSYQAMRKIRPDLQIIFQDPIQSLNPRQTVFSCLYEAVNCRKKLSKQTSSKMIIELLEQVKLDKTILSYLPGQLSGGQKQRVAIARALATNPKVIVADEPISSLDAPVRQEILDLLIGLKESRELTLILVTHDLRVAIQITDLLVFIYKGRIVEYGQTADLRNTPMHPYSKMLFSLITDNSIYTSEFHLASQQDYTELNTVCPYYTDCPIRVENCLNSIPGLKRIQGNHYVSCHQIPQAAG